jgi:urocanate hydratase
MKTDEFKSAIQEGIPDILPGKKPFNPSVNHAPKRKDILSKAEKKLSVQNALRYFKPEHHATLAPEFLEELQQYGRIYMHRLRPEYEMKAHPLEDYPHLSIQAASIMMMIQNNLDHAIAQHPHELITYGGNGAVFQNWAQYRLCMKYLSEMTDEQTLVLYSGHPMGLFPSHKDAPRVVVTNGMVIPNYSSRDDYERMNALGVSQYGQMTAGSFMYIGPQGIVHRAARNCTWNNHYSVECCQDARRRANGRKNFRFVGTWRNVGRPTQSSGYCRFGSSYC